MAESRSSAAQLLLRLGVALQELRALCQRGARPAADLHIRIDDESSTVIFEQIIHQIKESIATGQLQPGGRLPTVRQLADELGIAPGTVARAYSDLEGTGVLVTDRARGTFIAVPRRKAAHDPAQPSVRDLLRPAIVAAYHLGASADDVRTALEQAMMDIYPGAA
jgi:DNA-binding transcriptional regulator YhcF (GntR family)